MLSDSAENGNINESFSENEQKDAPKVERQESNSEKQYRGWI